VTALIDGRVVKLKSRGFGVLKEEVENFKVDCITMLEKRND